MQLEEAVTWLVRLRRAIFILSQRDRPALARNLAIEENDFTWI